VDLRILLDLCQEEHAEAWRVMPGGPAERMVTGLLDVAGSDEPPALAALQPMYRAVYTPDARLGLAWGVPAEDTRDRRDTSPPDWMPEEWSSTEPLYAIVLLNRVRRLAACLRLRELGRGDHGLSAVAFAALRRSGYGSPRSVGL